MIAQSLQERSGKQCRERFHNHLDKGIKKGDWTEEVGIVVKFQSSFTDMKLKIGR